MAEKPLEAAHVEPVQDPVHVPAAQESHSLELRGLGLSLEAWRIQSADSHTWQYAFTPFQI